MNLITPTFSTLSSSRLNYDYSFGGTAPVDEGCGVASDRSSSIRDLTSIFTEQDFSMWQNTRYGGVLTSLFPVIPEQGFGTQQDTRWITRSSAVKVDSKEALLLQLAEYQSLPDNWDGYGGKTASMATVMDSARFLLQFPSTFPLPKPMISGSGVISLYWEGNGCYASIDFDGSGYYCYIADSADEENGEDQVPVAQTLPPRLAEVIVMTVDDF
ncbi:hypothetical protein [Candidatus Thiosymbion oneisti]|uniref:hypothetical protein n=1 Tax=Candidatus Thiosymbion oneisti TaxID=589554 RepID=UPI00105BF6AA|nr:hypothetical protein [Candidatus Thiosymbion oneisti]